ncbi:MAG TPA: Wzz/FepE/Etk N-terminal domain-containing protein, partial [Chloroflexota bacterium]|nr:Wzz/FepE/Etk N-terminal domain-containing protein [Chloroflexota bacterium]
MELRGYLDVLERRKWIVLATTVVAVALVFFGTMNRTPGYSSSAMIRISEAGGSPVGYNEFNYSDRLISTYVQLMQGRSFLGDVISQLGLSLTPEELKGMVKVEQIANTELIRVTVNSTNASQSADIANTMATLLAAQYQQGGQVTSVVETAVVPQSSSGGRNEMYLLISMVVGLLGGIGLAYLMEKLDSAVHSMEQLEEAVTVPVVGWVPSIPGMDGGKGDSLLKEGAERSPVGEAFRLLSTGTLAAVGEDAPWDVKSHRALLITSAEPRSGKTTVAVNLAATIARTGQRVILVDANLKNPSLNGYFGTTGKVGLAEVLSNPARLESALLSAGVPGLRVLPAGVSS